MINHYSILAAIKAILDDDTELQELLESKGDSKVFIGTMPDKYLSPAVQIVLMTDEHRDTVHQLSDMTFYVNLHVMDNNSGESDIEQSSEIIDRLNDLIHNQQLEVAGHHLLTPFVEGRTPCVHNPENPGNSIEGLRCRIFAT
jgi:hypothetical protein